MIVWQKCGAIPIVPHHVATVHFHLIEIGKHVRRINKYTIYKTSPFNHVFMQKARVDNNLTILLSLVNFHDNKNTLNILEFT